MTHVKATWERAVEVVPLDAAILTRLVRPVAGNRRVAHAAPLEGGLANTNYRVVLDDGAALVVRAYTRDARAVAKERALSDLVSERVPAPRFLYADESKELIDAPFAIIEWLPGRNAAELQATADSAAASRLARSMGEVLAALQSYRFPAAGELDENLEVREPYDLSGQGYLDLLHALLFEQGAARHLDAEETRALLECAAAGSPELDALDERSPNLVHADFGPENVLVSDDLVVTGVLDWEFSFAGSSLLDIGHLLRPPWDEDPAIAAGFESGFRSAGGHLPPSWRRLSRFTDLLAWVEFLARPNAGPAVIRTCRDVLRKSVAALSR